MAGFIFGVLVFWWLMGWPFWILFAIVGVGAILVFLADFESSKKERKEDREKKRVQRQSSHLTKFRSEKSLPDDIKVLEEMIPKLEKSGDRERLKKVCVKAASLGSYKGSCTGTPLFYEDGDLVQANAMADLLEKNCPSYAVPFEFELDIVKQIRRDLAAQQGNEAFDAGRWKDCAEHMVTALSYSFTNGDQELLCCSRAAIAMSHYAKSTEEWDTVSNLLEMAGIRNHSMTDQLRSVQDLVQQRGNLLVPLRRIVENAERAERSGSIQTALRYAKQASAQGSGKGAVIAARLLAKHSSSPEEVQEAKRYAEIAIRRCHPDGIKTINFIRSKELPYSGNNQAAAKLGNKAAALNEIRKLQKSREYYDWTTIYGLMKQLNDQGEQIPSELLDLVQGYEKLYKGMNLSHYYDPFASALSMYESAIKLGCKAAYYGGASYLYEIAIYQSKRTAAVQYLDSYEWEKIFGAAIQYAILPNHKLEEAFTRALNWMEKAKEAFPDNPEIDVKLADIREKLSILTQGIIREFNYSNLYSESQVRDKKFGTDGLVTAIKDPWKSHPFFAFDVYSELVKYVHVDQ